MLDPTPLFGLGKTTDAPTKGATADPGFEKVFQKTLAPPGDPPPDAGTCSGPEESPTQTPNAESSQMDPPPQIPANVVAGLALQMPLALLTRENEETSAPEAPAMPVIAPLEATATVSPLEALGIQSVQPLPPQVAPAELLQKTPTPLPIPEIKAITSTKAENLEAKGDEPDSNDGERSDPDAPLPTPAPPTHKMADAKATPAETKVETKPPIQSRAQILDHIEVLAAKKSPQGVKIELNPLDLGPMTIQVSQEGREIRTHVVAENPALRFALHRAQADLTQSLSEAGMNLSHFSMESGQKYERQQPPTPGLFAARTQIVAGSARPSTHSGSLELWA
jgi:flagellar hook-length control protein FliK